MRIELDVEACVGHGRCYALAPEVFAPDERGHALVLVAEVPEDLRDRAETAARTCPEEAIRVVE